VSPGAAAQPSVHLPPFPPSRMHPFL
jgi:hypothetical protein